MGNILNHNRPIYQLRVSKSDYWDMHLSHNNKDTDLNDGMADKCLSAFIDVNEPECIENETTELGGRTNLVSTENYTWDEAVNNGMELNHIGYTGTDNGLILFDKDTITEAELEDIKKNSVLTLGEGDHRLRLTPVDGNNKIYSYDYQMVVEDEIKVAKLNGGFFQGFFQTNNGCNYKVLPNKLGDGWTMDFVLKPVDYDVDPEIVTLNTKYPQNKGIFFYVGTRAENKWYKIYSDPSNVSEINKKYTTRIETDNKFVTYNRTKDGLRANGDGDKDSKQEIVFDNRGQLDNYFIIMNRSKGGYTAKTIKDIVSENVYDYDILADLYRNALAFQIKDDGSVGYKFMVKDCEAETGYSIKEEWSFPGLIRKNEWNVITVRVMPVIKYANEYSNYGDKLDYMRLAFYVNGKLALWSKILPTLLLRVLNDDYSKQEGVPYNVSLGGGTQGLCDVIYGLHDIPEDILFLEKEFGGSFTGLVRLFTFHSCDLNYQEIYHNYIEDFSGNMNNPNKGKIYYGTLSFEGLSSNNPLNDEDIFTLKTAPNDSKRLNLHIPVGARRIVIAIPHDVCKLKSVFDGNKMGIDITSSFEYSILTKKDYELKPPRLTNPIRYDIYVIDYAFHNGSENNYIVEL